MRRVFYEGETVRSRYYGLGEVARSGERPIVRSLDRPGCAAEDLDLGFEKPDTGVATGGASLGEEVQSHVEPAAHRS